MFQGKTELLLDMNSTFMFGEDRFGEDEDFAIFYQTLGGSLAAADVNRLISDAYAYLDQRYPKLEYRERFPTLAQALTAVSPTALPDHELQRLIATFAHHECGEIPLAYRQALKQLAHSFTLALVIDIWAPKQKWLELFQRYGILHLFSVMSFSSDHGHVKPSSAPFELVVSELVASKSQCLVIGDSARRDLGGALAANLDCVLVGKETDKAALAHYPSLLELTNDLLASRCQTVQP